MLTGTATVYGVSESSTAKEQQDHFVEDIFQFTSDNGETYLEFMAAEMSSALSLTISEIMDVRVDAFGVIPAEGSADPSKTTEVTLTISGGPLVDNLQQTDIDGETKAYQDLVLSFSTDLRAIVEEQCYNDQSACDEIVVVVSKVNIVGAERRRRLRADAVEVTSTVSGAPRETSDSAVKASMDRSIAGGTVTTASTDFNAASRLSLSLGALACFVMGLLSML